MLFERFMNLYHLLTVRNEMIVVSLLYNLEHLKVDPKDKITYSESIKTAMRNKNMTRKELIHQVEELTHFENVESAINSLLYRNTCNSYILPYVMQILDIDQTYLISHSGYFYPLLYDLRTSFETLPLQNQRALIGLLADLINLQTPRRIHPRRKTTKISRRRTE